MVEMKLADNSSHEAAKADVFNCYNTIVGTLGSNFSSHPNAGDIQNCLSTALNDPTQAATMLAVLQAYQSQISPTQQSQSTASASAAVQQGGFDQLQPTTSSAAETVSAPSVKAPVLEFGSGQPLPQEQLAVHVDVQQKADAETGVVPVPGFAKPELLAKPVESRPVTAAGIEAQERTGAALAPTGT